MIFKEIERQDLKNKIKNEEKILLLDIRKTEDFNKGNIENSINVNQNNINDTLKEITYDTQIVVICYRGISSKKMAQEITNIGFQNTYSLIDGYNKWHQ